MISKIKNPHDLTFRRALSDIRVAKDFFQQYLPEKIKSRVNFATLKPSKKSFVDKELKESIADVLYSVDIDDKPGYFYLHCEHLSSRKNKRFVPFRILKYKVSIMEHHINKHNAKELPVVYSIVFYHGKKPYDGPVDIIELFNKDQQTLVRELFLESFQLIDLSQIEDEALKAHLWSGVMSMIFKNIFTGDMLTVLKKLKRHLIKLEKCEGDDFMITMLNYIIDQAEANDKHKILEFVEETLPSETGGVVMTIAESLRQEGREEGREEGRKEGHAEYLKNIEKVARKLFLEDGIPPQRIQELTGLNPETM